MNENKLSQIYNALRLLGKNASTQKVAEILGVSRRTVQRYLRVLIENEYVEPVRYGMRIYYRVLKPLTEEEARLLTSKRDDVREAPPYELARKILNIVREARLKADLIGASKIHFEVPTHTRITHDVDVIVISEHAHALVALLKYGLGLVIEKIRGVHVDYRLRHPTEDIKVDVLVDGFKEERRIVWNLAPVLRRDGKLSLEHAVAAKLTRRLFDMRTDAYDVTVSLPHLNIERFVAIYIELEQVNPLLARRIPEHLAIVEDYIAEEYGEPDADLLANILSRLKIKLGLGERKRLRGMQ